MLQRGAARLLTGPAAFLAAGIIDLLVFSWHAMRRQMASRTATRPPSA